MNHYKNTTLGAFNETNTRSFFLDAPEPNQKDVAMGLYEKLVAHYPSVRPQESHVLCDALDLNLATGLLAAFQQQYTTRKFNGIDPHTKTLHAELDAGHQDMLDDHEIIKIHPFDAISASKGYDLLATHSPESIYHAADLVQGFLAGVVKIEDDTRAPKIEIYSLIQQ